MQAERETYTRAEVMGWDRQELLDFFKSEGPPDGLRLDHIKNAATETLKQLVADRLNSEGRLTE